jgi:RHH-type rel operon transcriptional repressor/antitoxin RelB
MADTTMTQMNIRIDASLKASGDEALSSVGLTPTRAVRALWECASQRGEQLEDIRRLLLGDAEADRGEAVSDALEDGWRIVPAGLASLGIPQEALRAIPCYESLLEEARMERARQKGWL